MVIPGTLVTTSHLQPGILIRGGLGRRRWGLPRRQSNTMWISMLASVLLVTF